MACKRWTYGADPSRSPEDALRFLVGDTIQERPLLDDNEVLYLTGRNTNLNIAAAEACEALWSRFCAISDYTVGSVSKKYSDMAAKFKERAADFRKDASRNALVSFPSTLASTKQTLEDDSELSQPQFSIGMGDNPEALQLNNELSELWRLGGW